MQFEILCSGFLDSNSERILTRTGLNSPIAVQESQSGWKRLAMNNK